MIEGTTTRKVLIAGAGVVIGMYLALAFVALFCVVSHSGMHGHLTHNSPLCSWACQANNSATLITLMSPVLPILLFISLLDFSLRQAPVAKRAHFSSRGPPR